MAAFADEAVLSLGAGETALRLSAGLRREALGSASDLTLRKHCGGLRRRRLDSR
jgi:hypothetical protein